MRDRTLPCLVLLALSLPSAADAWVVAPTPGPGVDFAEIQDAVLAAVDGDLVLVRPGTYTTPIVITGKRVSIVADLADDDAPRPRVLALEPLRIQNLGADQDVFVRGLELEALPADPGQPSFPGVLVDACAGTVLVENCECLGAGANPGGFAHPGVRVAACAGGVEIVRCRLEGGVGFTYAPGLWGPTRGAAGLEVQAARAVLYDSELVGGHGGLGSFSTGCIFTGCSVGREGGPGVQLMSGTQLIVRGSLLIAGASGDGTGSGSLEGTAGADAIESTTTTLVQVQDSTFLGGAGGVGDVSTGFPGLAFDVGVTPQFLPEVPRTFAIQTPRRAGENAVLRFEGAPNDFFLLSTSAQSFSLELFDVWSLFLGVPIVSVPSGVFTVPSSGTNESSFPMPPSIGADEFRFAFCQALYSNVQLGQVGLSSPSVAVVLAPGF